MIEDSNQKLRPGAEMMLQRPAGKPRSARNLGRGGIGEPEFANARDCGTD